MKTKAISLVHVILYSITSGQFSPIYRTSSSNEEAGDRKKKQGNMEKILQKELEVLILLHSELRPNKFYIMAVQFDSIRLYPTI